MSKPFITYTAQVEKLKNEKNLVITDDDFAVESLQNISYYALIGGYKHPFIDIHTRKSVENMANARKNISTPIITAIFVNYSVTKLPSSSLCTP